VGIVSQAYNDRITPNSLTAEQLSIRAIIAGAEALEVGSVSTLLVLVLASHVQLRSLELDLRLGIEVVHIWNQLLVRIFLRNIIHLSSQLLEPDNEN
jgi:hypothetical protein